MYYKRFLPILIFAFLFNLPSYCQYNLIKDFDGTEKSSFAFNYSGILYSIDTKLLVQYDSIAAGEYTNIACLAAVDIAGNSQQIAFSTFESTDLSPFFDFTTLPDGNVAFIAIESDESFKIVITDGTTSGTKVVYTSAQAINGLEIIDNGLYFTYDGAPNHALVKIDLSTRNVSHVIEFGYFHMMSDISKVSNEALIFMAPDASGDNALKLYVSDGTTAGTTALATINTGSEVSQNTVMIQVGNKVYFFYKRPGVDCCNDLWVTDGTVTGTQKIKEFNSVNFAAFEQDRKAIGWKDKFYFSGVEVGSNSNIDQVLWVSDGTSAGTVALTNSSAENIYPRRLTVFKDALYFITFNGTLYENKLYKTDGTLAGTEFIELKYNAYSISPYSLASTEDYLYMGAGNANSSFGTELFRYDGIHPQCSMLEGVIGGMASEPDNLYLLDTDLYFTAQIAETGKELYTIGGDFIPGITTDTKSAVSDSYVIYPNPASNHITVKSTGQTASMHLINQFGDVVAETNENALSLSTFPEGIYFVEVRFVNGDKSFEKIILIK